MIPKTQDTCHKTSDPWLQVWKTWLHSGRPAGLHGGRTCQDMSGHVKTFLDMSGHVWTCLDMSWHVWTCLDMSGHVWKCMDMSEHVWTCLNMSEHVWTCLNMSGHKSLKLASVIQLELFKRRDFKQRLVNDYSYFAPDCLHPSQKLHGLMARWDTLDTRHPTPDTRHQTPDTRHSHLTARHARVGRGAKGDNLPE